MKSKAIIGIFLFLLLSCNSSEFNADSWKGGAERDRGKMSQSLLEKNILDHRSKDEIFEILGAPDFESADCVSYNLDLGGIAWSYFLEICLDQESRRSCYVQIND